MRSALRDAVVDQCRDCGRLEDDGDELSRSRWAARARSEGSLGRPGGGDG